MAFRQHVLIAFFMLASLVSHDVRAETNVLFIVDASGSMKKKIGEEFRIDVAKKVLDETVKSMPSDARLGLLVYGHRKAKDCSDLELMVPIGGEDATTIASTIAKLEAKGETPIAESLTKAAKSFNAFKGQQNSIILVTDGIEECKGDPCAAAKKLKDAGLDVAVNIVGFTLNDEESKALQCVTETTGGKYYAAADAAGLTEALKQVQTKVQETVVVQTAEAPKPTNDILAEANGGKLEYAPNKAWNLLNSNHTEFFQRSMEAGATYDGEAVWSFKDGKPATFDQIEVLVPKAYEYNLKDFEVLAADEMTGPYKSLGAFTVQNVKMMPEGWQGFKFPETTARFVKVIFKSHHGGGYVRGNALRLIGKIDENAPAAEKPAEIDGTDLLAKSAGGTLLVAPSEEWQKLNDGNPDERATTYDGEGVWAFNGERPALLEAVEFYLPAQHDYALKDFEVLVGDEGPSGQFKSIGTFTAQNRKVMPEGWQRFAFPKVKAKYLKIKFVSGYGGYIAAHEFRALGKIDENAPATEKPSEIDGKDLLAQSAGGTLLMSPNDEWKKLNDGKTDERATTYDGEGVWAFNGEKPVMLEAVEHNVPAQHDYALKDFEVLVGDEGPTGAFKSLGTFTAQNVKVMPDGWQRFTFPKVKTKYLKIRLVSGYGGYISAHEFRAIGKPAE